LTDQKDNLNSITDIKKFLSENAEPVTMAEMSEFWNSLSDKEKAEFRNSPLPKE
jgi:hypothetical protein